MVIGQPENNPSYYYRASPAHSIALNVPGEHLMFYTYQLQHQGNS